MHHSTYRITHTTAFATQVVEHWLEREIDQWVHHMKDRSDEPSHHLKWGSEIYLTDKSVRSCCDGLSDRAFMVDPLGYFYRNVKYCVILMILYTITCQCSTTDMTTRDSVRAILSVACCLAANQKE